MSTLKVKKSVDFLLIALLTFIGGYLRFRNLGSLGLSGDEDLTGLAARGIFEKFYPAMPSGMPYLRGLPFSYLVAFCISIFGENEFSMRFPSFVFGTLKIPLLFLFCRTLINRKVGLIAAALLTFSIWDIQVSRTARMYSMFSFFYLLSLYVFYRGFLQGNKKFIYWTPASIITAIFVHRLGVSLVGLFIIPFLITGYDLVKRKTIIFHLLSMGIAGIIIMKGISEKFVIQRQIGQAENFEGIFKGQNFSGWFFENIPPMLVPKQELLTHMVENYFPVWGFILLCFVFGLLLLIRFRFPGYDTRYNIFIGIGLAGAGFCQAYGLAGLILLFHLYRSGGGVAVLLDAPVKTWLGILSLGFFLWIGYGIFLWRGGDHEIHGLLDLLRKTVKSLIYYPPVDFRTFIGAYPKMSIAVFFSLLLAVHRVSVNKKAIVYLFLTYSFLAPLVLNGVMMQWTQPRYSFHLYPIFLLLFAWIVYESAIYFGEVLMKSNKNLGPITWMKAIGYKIPRSGVSFLIGVFIIGFLAEHNWAKQAYGVSSQSYGDNTLVELDGSGSYPDHKGVSLFIKKRLEREDLIIAEDPYVHFYYLGKVNYRVKSRRAPSQSVDGRGLNIYTNTKTIHDLNELLDVLENNENRVWYITSNAMVPETRKQYVEKGIEGFLEKNRKNIVYVGRDRKTKVYFFNSEDK